MKSRTERILLPIGFAILAIALTYLWVKVEKPFAPPAYKAGVAEDLLQAEAAQLVVVPKKVYASYSLVRNFGVQKSTGATWVQTEAWSTITNDPTADNERFLIDLVRTLKESGELDDIDLNRSGNYLVVLWPGAPPRPDWVLDSREIVKEEVQ